MTWAALIASSDAIGAQSTAPPGLLLDINTTPPPIPSSRASAGIEFGNTILFTGTTPSTGRELFAVPATGGAARLVLDLNPGSADSDPAEFTIANGRVFFSAREANNSRDLWVTDGTGPGTLRVADLDRNSAVSGMYLTPFGTGVLFFGELVQTGRQLWFSDGTAAGSTMVRQIGFSNTLPSADITSLGSFAVFTTTGGSQLELWRTDGTAGGTVRIAVPNTIQPTNRSYALVRRGSTVFFLADGGYVRSLWSTDGTSSGTGVVSVFSANTTRFPAELVLAGSQLYFAGTTVSSRFDLWTSDGTTQGTRMVAPLSGGVPERLTPFGTTLLFAVGLPGTYRLWASDGTAAGTQQLETLALSLPIGPMTVGPMTVAAGQLFVAADDGVSGVELWTTNGQPGNARRVTDLAPGPLSSDPADIIALASGKVAFGALDPTIGRELWCSDGTQPGPTLLADVTPNIPGATRDSLPHRFFAAPEPVFVADDGSGHELWTTDGTTSGTRKIADLEPGTANISVSSGTVLGDRVVMGLSTRQSGTEPWVTDGTTQGTLQLADINPGSASSYVEMFAMALGNRALFRANATGLGIELYSTDGTPAGTRLLADAAAGPTGSIPVELARVGPRLLYTALTVSPSTGNLGRELWATDGTPTGTRLLADLFPGIASSDPRDGVRLGKRVFFSAIDTGGREPWISDGTTGGTARLLDLNPGATSSMKRRSTPLSLGDRVVFFADDGMTGLEPWVTGGTAGSTFSLADLTSQQSTPSFRSLFVSHGLAYFSVDDKLWRSDGTVAGTFALQGASAFVARPVVAHATIDRGAVFNAGDGQTGVEPWITDGTTAGTRRLADLVPGPGSSLPHGFAATGSRFVFFFAAGRVWRTDGTTMGTVEVAALGSPSYAPGFHLAGDQLVFPAAGSIHGVEPFRLAPGASSRSMGQGCSGTAAFPELHATDAVLGTAMTLSGDSGAARVPSALVLGLRGASRHLGNGCITYIDLSKTIVPVPLTLSGSAWSLSARVPAAPSLQGVTLAWQTVHGRSPGTAALDLSPTLWTTLGL